MHKLTFVHCGIKGCEQCKRAAITEYWNSWIGRKKSLSGNGSKGFMGKGLVLSWERGKKAQWCVWLYIYREDIGRVFKVYAEMDRCIRERIKSL